MSKNKQLKKNLFNQYTCFDGLTDIILCEDSISKLVTSFWSDIFPLYKDNYILIQLRIRSGDNYYSLSKLQSVNYDSKEALMAILNESLTIMYERYTQFPIDELFLRFLILPKGSRWEKVVIRPMIIETKHFESLSQINLPLTLDLTKWGKDTKLSSTLTTVLTKDGTLLTIESNGDIRSISVLVNNEKVMSFTDTIINAAEDHFIRTLENGTVIEYLGGLQIKLQPKIKEAVYMKTLDPAKSTHFEEGVITMDFETRKLKDDSSEVISIAIYDGKEYKTYFLNDYQSSSQMLHQLIEDLFNNHMYDGKTIFLHNLSGFDGAFILKYLAENSPKFNICMKDSKIINLTVTRIHEIAGNKCDIKIKFNDSLLLLPAKLEDLSEAFGGALKGEFDHTKSNNCSSFQDFEAIRDELLTYNKQDCLVLHQVLTLFPLPVHTVK